MAERDSDVRVRSRFAVGDREAAALRADLDLTRTSERIASKRSRVISAALAAHTVRGSLANG
jgi:hypothetical protein